MRKCKIIFNSPLTGHIFQPIQCSSIAAAIRTAKEMNMPFRLFSEDGKLIRRGWYV